jgi:2-desacetyl-2-hydroxyethyl bacteriochlorophyllide A dehydrogenase
MNRRSLIFTGPRTLAVRNEVMPVPGPGELRIRSTLSAISPGTELLIYRGEAPRALAADASIAALDGGLDFPLKYGYACVGLVDAVGAGVDAAWLQRRVFAFNPHESAFVAPVSAVQPIPDGILDEDAAFLPNMESAVNFVLDGAPLLGERVAVIGQGVVGLLTTALLARMSPAALIAIERVAFRRTWALRMGATHAVDPADVNAFDAIREQADLAFELSGAPAALDTAIAATGFGGRVVIGSWYGSKPVTVDLGGRFHRSRIQLIASQVSTLTPALAARWDKARRFELAWRMLAGLRPSQLITQRLALEDAAQAYRLIDAAQGEALQVLLRY